MEEELFVPKSISLRVFYCLTFIFSVKLKKTLHDLKNRLLLDSVVV